MSAYLDISKVSKVFETKSGQFPALENVDLKISQGEFISLIGHSGCGKSTVLNVVAGLYDATEGCVILDGKEVDRPGPDRSVVFQNHALFPWLTVYDNVMLAVKDVFKGRKSKAEMKEWVLHNLELVHMSHALHKRPDEISGGMKQRVGIARALAMEPKVLLMDEPFGALDALTRAHLQDSLMEIHQRLNNTVIMITHDVDEAVLLSDRIVMMTNGPSATVGEIMDVDLLRPRKRLELADDPQYNKYRAGVLHFLHERHAKPDVPLATEESAAHSVKPETKLAQKVKSADETVELGFIPLTDAAPLIVGVENGLFKKHGVNVTLVKETSWASIRDKVSIGMLDGAQMLATMPLAAKLGAGGPKHNMIAPFTLSRGGDAITLSRDLYRELCLIEPTLQADLSLSGSVLKRYIDILATDGKQKLTLGMVFPTATHNYLLREWLGQAGIDPDNDVKLAVIPPPQMVKNLENGNIAGFCVGEPWNTHAIQQGIGVAVATSNTLWKDHPEKVLGLDAKWAEDNQETVIKLIKALAEACDWLTSEDNCRQAAELLSKPEWLGQPVELLLPSLVTGFQHSADASAITTQNLHCFGPIAQNRPDSRAALWFLAQMYRWGQIERPVALTSISQSVFDRTLFDEAMGKVELVDNSAPAGANFNANDPLQYLTEITVGERPGWASSALSAA